jgi:uncharacterized membrane protein YfcA
MTAWRDARDDLDRKVAQLKRSRRKRSSPWRTAIHAGTLGWMLVLPAVLGGALGHYLGRAIGKTWPAVVGVMLGLIIGAYGVWRQVRTSLEDEDEEEAP